MPADRSRFDKMPDARTPNDELVEALTVSVWDLHDAFEAGVDRIVEAIGNQGKAQGSRRAAPAPSPDTEPARKPRRGPAPSTEPARQPAEDPEPETEPEAQSAKPAPRKRAAKKATTPPK